jgi:hypothetical protein
MTRVRNISFFTIVLLFFNLASIMQFCFHFLYKDHVASCPKERERVIKEGTEVKWQMDTWRVGEAALQVLKFIWHVLNRVCTETSHDMTRNSSKLFLFIYEARHSSMKIFAMVTFCDHVLICFLINYLCLFSVILCIIDQLIIRYVLPFLLLYFSRGLFIYSPPHVHVYIRVFGPQMNTSAIHNMVYRARI